MTRTGATWKGLVLALRGRERLNGVAEESTARGFYLLLSYALIWILLLQVVVVPFFAVRPKEAALVGIVLAAATLGAFLVRARRIRIRSASLLFVTTLWCVVEGVSALNGGLRSGLYGLVVLIIVNAVWLLGKSSAIGLAAATLFVSLAEVVLKYSGHSLPRYFPGTPAGNWLVFAGILLFAVNPVLAILETLQKQVATLRDSEEHFHTIVDSVNDAIFVHEIDSGRILDVNLRAREMFGYSGEELRLLSVEALSEGHPPYSQAEAMKHFASVRAGIPQVFDWLARHRDGHLFWVEVAIGCARVSGKDCMVVVERDITTRKRMEEELRESKERYQSLIECLGEGILSVGLPRRVLMTNPAGESILGVPRGGAIGRDLSEFVDPADMPLLASEAARRERGEKGNFELRVIRPDGERRTLQVTATPQYDTSGQFQSSLAVIRDITEEKRLLQRLKLLAHTLDSVDECVSICDPGDRLLFVNRAFLRTYGYEESKLIGEHIGIVRSPLNSGEATSGILPGTLAGGWRGELWNRRRDGTDFLVMLNTAAVTDGDGRVEATVGVARDITEHKRAEAELMRARDLAESANRAKSEFLAMMSHEIRTPLNGVIGMTGLLLDTELSPEQREYAETARGSGESLLGVINDILDFSKIEAGRMVIESFAFDLRLVIEEVNEMLASKIEDRKLDLVLEYPPDVPRHFLGDAGRVRQVVTNLVGNAVKFTPHGHVLITVNCESDDGEKADIWVAVEDTGPGIPAEKLGGLFEEFSQVDGSTTRKYGGTGLGLAISKKLVNLMGGEVGVNSLLGKGSTFWFTVPLHLDTQPHAEPAPVADLRDLRVLVVDDNDVNRRVLVEQIASWGMRNGSYAGAGEALQALREARAAGDPYQVALLDYQMPDMDGATLAAAIRADLCLSETVLIMLTSVGHWSEVRHMQGAGIDACLVKPARQSQLLNTLATAWSKKMPSGFTTRTKALHQVSSLKSKRASRFAGAPVRVLVAEDNLVNQKVAVRMLERLGLQPDIAGNGREAVERCALLPYDLIFMDCQMPEVDGYTATAEIRKRQRGNGRAAIIAMTAEAMAGCRERCIAAGMDDYIAKPVRLDDMIEALKKWVPQAIPAARV